MSVRSLSRPLLLLLLAPAALSVSGCGGAQARFARHLAKGEAFLADANFDKARIEFQNALQIEPKNPQARLEMGVVDEKLGKPREAAQFYQGVIDVSPDNAEARARLGRLYLFSAAPDQALELIRPALEKHPDDAALLTVRAAVRVQQKDLDAALTDGQRAVALDPKSEDAVAVLAGIYRARNETDKAQALLEQSVQRIPGTTDLRLVLAQIYLQEKRPADAEAQLLKLIALQPHEKAHRLRLAQFYAQQNQVDAAEKALRQAIKDMPEERDLKLSLVSFLAGRRGREIAEQELRGMIAASPGDYELQFSLAEFYQDGKEPAKAKAVYQGIIDKESIAPPGLTARDRLARLKLQENDFPGALALANEVLAKSPRDDDALMIRGNIALAKQDPRAAIADLRAVLRDQPNAEGVVRTLARAHLANGEPALAEETMRHAAEANPGNAALQLDFAQLLAQMGKAEQTKPIIAELVKRSPDNLAARDAQYRVAMATHDLDTAEAAADALVALRPKQAGGYLYQGMVAEERKHNDDALRLFDQAAKLQPDATEPLEAVVRVLVNMKRAPDAIKRLDESAAAYPSSSFALVIKGELLLRTGRNAEAKDVFKQAIARTPKWWPPYRGLAAAELANKEDSAVAIATLRDAKHVVDQNEQLVLQLAAILEKAGKPDEAVQEYEEVIRKDPQSELVANNLAMLLATYRTDQASLDRAKDLSARFANSPNPSYLDTYGWVLYKRGDAASSVPVLSKVVAAVPDAVLARYHLGMAQSAAGDETDARDNLNRAVKSGTLFVGLDEARATLVKLSKLPSVASSPKS
jgi:tetratricopeptide (TPR) repeat protein